jgi:methyltransferase
VVSSLGLDSRLLFVGLVAAVAAMRLGELRIARRNTRRALAAGAIEVGAGHYRAMVAMHAAFLVSAPVEVYLLERTVLPALAAPSLLLLAFAATVRVWVIRTLGTRWTTRIVCLPGNPVTRSGPYRYLRHPNYLAVAVEIVALPLVHTAFVTAAVFSVLNALVLRRRIRMEEEALGKYSAYREVFG